MSRRQLLKLGFKTVNAREKSWFAILTRTTSQALIQATQRSEPSGLTVLISSQTKQCNGQRAQTTINLWITGYLVHRTLQRASLKFGRPFQAYRTSSVCKVGAVKENLLTNQESAPSNSDCCSMLSFILSCNEDAMSSDYPVSISENNAHDYSQRAGCGLEGQTRQRLQILTKIEH